MEAEHDRDDLEYDAVSAEQEAQMKKDIAAELKDLNPETVYKDRCHQLKYDLTLTQNKLERAKVSNSKLRSQISELKAQLHQLQQKPRPKAYHTDKTKSSHHYKEQFWDKMEADCEEALSKVMDTYFVKLKDLEFSKTRDANAAKVTFEFAFPEVLEQQKQQSEGEKTLSSSAQDSKASGLVVGEKPHSTESDAVMVDKTQ